MFRLILSMASFIRRRTVLRILGPDSNNGIIENRTVSQVSPSSGAAQNLAYPVLYVRTNDSRDFIGAFFEDLLNPESKGIGTEYPIEAYGFAKRTSKYLPVIT